MRKHSIIFIGLDTHKEFTQVAYVEDGREHSAVHLGRISSNKAQLGKFSGHSSLNTLKQHCILSMKLGLAATGSSDS